MNKKILLIFVFLLFLKLNFSQDRRINYEFYFLTISPDARASGLGEQGVATNPDVFSQHWNPSKYVFSDQSSGIGFGYSPYLSKLINDSFLINVNYFNIINERSSWSTSFKYFTLGNIDIIQNPQDIPIIESPNGYTLDASYSLKLTDSFAMAFTGRYSISDFKSQYVGLDSQPTSSFAFDISGFFQSDERAYENFNGIWRVGFNLSNLGARVRFEDGGDKDFIPTNLKVGSAFDFIFDSSNKFSLNLELNKLLVPSPSIPIYSNDQIIGYEQDDIGFLSGIFKSFGDAPDGFSEELKEITLAFGLEYLYNESFALRAGYFNEHASKGARKYLTFGTGFKKKTFSKKNAFNLDLSYLNSTSEVSNPFDKTIRFSFTYNFN